MYSRLAAITGMPRSGTSWVSQIFDSSPSVRYRLSPLFSHEFKNQVGTDASRADWERVFRGSYVSDNEFMDQTARRAVGQFPRFAIKDNDPPWLVVKFNRFQNLVEPLLTCFPELRMVSIVRHPCGAIHSWLTAPKEFPPGADPLEHWRSGAAKKTGPEDFFGFDDWKRVTRLHLRLQAERPDQLRIERYEDLVEDPTAGTERMFEFVGLELTEQTRDFLKASQARHDVSEYAVFKDKAVKDRWRRELQAEIRTAILDELDGTDLAPFCQP